MYRETNIDNVCACIHKECHTKVIEQAIVAVEFSYDAENDAELDRSLRSVWKRFAKQNDKHLRKNKKKKKKKKKTD
jgi:hypothetical protein